MHANIVEKKDPKSFFIEIIIHHTIINFTTMRLALSSTSLVLLLATTTAPLSCSGFAYNPTKKDGFSSFQSKLEEKKRVVVVGNGMVGQRFMENMLKDCDEDELQLVTFCEESRAAYNRVRLTSFFENRKWSWMKLIYCWYLSLKFKCILFYFIQLILTR